MEDLTDQVEIVFHPTPDSIDPTIIPLEAVDAEQPSTSAACKASGNIFKTPGLPKKIPKKPKAKARADNDDDEWEETMIYVDLDDIPSVQELFAFEPDDFLLGQSKREREQEPKFITPTRRSLDLKFYNLDDENPILQIGDRFYMGTYEEPCGTELFFREKADLDGSDSEGDKDSLRKKKSHPPKTVLPPLVSDPDPPSHPVFGKQKKCTTEYELVAKAHTVLKMTRRNVLRSKDSKGDKLTDTKPSDSTSALEASLLSSMSDDSAGDVGLPPDIVAQPILERFVPKRSVDLSRHKSFAASMRSKLKK